MARILVVDDEPSVVAAFAELLGGQGHDVLIADTGETALVRVAADRPDVVVTDICLPGISGMEFFRRIRQTQPRLPVIIMTGRGTMESAIEATQLGAFDYQLKPFEPAEMLHVIERAVQTVQLMERRVDLDVVDSPLPQHDALIGRSTGMQHVYKAIGRVAGTDATVLIRGESGTGKELVARAIYQHSLRHQAPLVVVNCAAIPEALLESELFGHERGAFTGAGTRRIGKFEQAQSGTLFLDEIGEMSLATQAKLLRVLQDRTIERLGGQGSIHVDVRILAATNRNLEQAIAAGAYREDLFHRLNVVSIQLPPLRGRREDIHLLAKYFTQRYAAELKVDEPLWSDEALAELADHPWHGNVRELANTIYRLLIFTRGYPIGPAEVRTVLERARDAVTGPRTLDEEQLVDFVRGYLERHGGPRAHERLLDMIEAILLRLALERTQGNQTHAAGILGLPRPTLHAKLRKHGLIGE